MINFVFSSVNLNSFHFKNWIHLKLSSNSHLYLQGATYSTYNFNKQRLIIVGDCINTSHIKSRSELDAEFLVSELKGNFYAILDSNGSYSIISSGMGLLPLYYKIDFSIISSSVKLICLATNNHLTEDKEWLISQVLFNYQFGENTFYKEIKLIPTFSYIKQKENKFEIYRYFSVSHCFSKKPVKWRKSIEDLSNSFISTVRQYIPKKDGVISFTGGFDGRTLTSIALYLNRKLATFSYGKENNDDVKIPREHSKILGIPYTFLSLGEDYTKSDYLDCAKSFIDLSSGGNGLLYAHMVYSAKKLSTFSHTLISGVCGSELFRAFHNSGAVTSQALVDLFRFEKFEEYKNSILNNKSLQYIKLTDYSKEIDSIIIKTWAYKTSLSSILTQNQKLYIFVYEELFRKFFGAWVTSQMNFLNIRTPYVDIAFFKDLIRTELSGAYSSFLTENPLKRFKGQVFYSDVIKRTNPILYKLKTGKGYAPVTVRAPLARPKLLIPFLTKRLKRKIQTPDLDNLGIISGIHNNIKELDILIEQSDNSIKKQELSSALKNLTASTKEKERDSILCMLSIFLYQNMLDE